MPSIIELNLERIFDPEFGILISLLTTRSRLMKLKLVILHASDPLELAMHEYPTGSLYTLVLGYGSFMNVVELATNYSAQIFSSIKHLVVECSQSTSSIIVAKIPELIRAVGSKILHFTVDLALWDEFPQSHIFIDLPNQPSSRCLTLNFTPKLVDEEKEEKEADDDEDNDEDDDDENEDDDYNGYHDEFMFNFPVSSFLKAVATAVTIDELKIWFHDECLESGLLEVVPLTSLTRLCTRKLSPAAAKSTSVYLFSTMNRRGRFGTHQEASKSFRNVI
ncbi:hypothetical protein BDQ12DRAFT_714794 [Crucibulum laeve]|uniref:Uncharacterized protein n=1 Tax=Crucibulum laeve TaxID=68775 RepID=A0A5C3LQS5_9AGAR|nr:hypothetical protein BDQ12DRAFT_714794 [Crucibulum laeve]